MIATTIMARALEWVGVVSPQTRAMVPAMAAPNEEPRLETLRDSPESLPRTFLGRGRLHEVDRWGELNAERTAPTMSNGRDGSGATGSGIPHAEKCDRYEG